MPAPKTLASASLKVYSQGMRCEVSLERDTDPRMMLLMAHGLLEALERKGYITPSIAQAKPYLAGQMKEWGFTPGPAQEPGGLFSPKSTV